MMNSKTALLLAGALILPVAVSGQDSMEIPPEIMEAIQGDISTIHMDVMQATIRLEPGQAGAFWGVYEEYLSEAQELTAQRTELVRDFAVSFETMTDASASEIGQRALALENRRIDLLGEYFGKISDDVGGIAAGQFLQIENRIATLKDLRLAMDVPIVGG
jgi:hypothetical protein